MPNTDDLTPEALRYLYEEEGLTDSEIAKRFSTYQVRVSRLRKQWGIATRTHTDRLSLPALTGEQRSLLLGSMLGDGRLFKTGKSTAAYSEHHSLDQEAYLAWKADKWGPFVCSVRSALKTTNGKTYDGKILRLHGCEAFYPYWKKFYPTGSGAKSFGQFPGRLTALALAVWYMDDGSKTWHGYVRLAITPVQEERDILLRLLGQLGLNPRYHVNRDGSDPSIWIHDRTSLSKFVDLVAPHIPECMAYKLDLQPRSRGSAPRHRLTKDVLAPLVSQGWGAARISDMFGVSVGAVRRAMDRFEFERPSVGRPRRVHHIGWDDAKAFASSPGVTDEDLVQCYLRLPHPPKPSREEAEADWGRLLAATPEIVDGMVKASGVGQKVSGHFFDYRQAARYRGLPSLKEAWFDPVWVAKAIHFQRRVGDPVLPGNVYRALRAVLRSPTNFRPAAAKAIVEAYSLPGGFVLDPCAGYGGRALGALAAGRRYLGIDPHPSAKSAFEAMRSLIGGRLDFVPQPFEEASVEEQADLVFTSPPYFSVERYSDDVTQSWVRYPTWESWVSGFLRPFVSKSRQCLRSSGRLVVNTKNVKFGRKIYPIADETVELALKHGFTHECTLQLPLGTLGRKGQGEPILVFKAV